MKLLVPSLPLRAMLHEIQERKKLRQGNASAAAIFGIAAYRAAAPPTRFRAPPPPAAPPGLLMPAVAEAGTGNQSDGASLPYRW
jgi:hypothetical protein